MHDIIQNQGIIKNDKRKEERMIMVMVTKSSGHLLS